MEWQLIETAPTDRETLMNGFLAAHIYKEENGEMVIDGIEWLGVLGASGKRLCLNSNNYSSFPATHWMPLLPAPQE